MVKARTLGLAVLPIALFCNRDRTNGKLIAESSAAICRLIGATAFVLMARGRQFLCD